MLDARRLEVYFEGFDTRGNVIEHLRCQIIDANSFNAFLPCLVVGDANEKIAALTEDPRVSFIDEKLSAKYQATLAYKKYQEQHFEDLAYCSPIYLKGANGVLL
jgi:tRNA threonylcarbamoyladenosine biosynthesis protein TsaB